MVPVPKVIFAILLLTTLTACAGPSAEHRPPGGPRGGGIPLENGGFLKPAGLLFAGFDTDHDYKISPQEFAAGLDTAFARADTDHSGALSLFEYQNWAGRALGSPTALPAWMSVDQNGDNVISRDEFDAAFQTLANKYGLSAPGGIALSALTLDTAEVIARTGRSGGRQGERGRPQPGPGPDSEPGPDTDPDAQ